MASILDPDRFSHKKSRYERPGNRYRCGRARMWGKACTRGPSWNGQCGGTADCLPVTTSNGSKCRRQGGPCEKGPKPGGECRFSHPPCTPILSDQIQRKRLNWVAAFLVLALISISWWPASDEYGATNPANINTTFVYPGELTHSHQAFTSSIGCGACHDGHLGNASPWRVEFALTGENIDCTSCHQLSVGEHSPHNSDPLTTACYRCHKLHNDHEEAVVELSDGQCSKCHENDYESFEHHSPFGEAFPHGELPNIVFDHAKHFDFHFKDKKQHAEVAPKTCASCHDPQPSNSDQPVATAQFESACGDCHSSDITDVAKAEMTLLRLPKLKPDKKHLADYQQCGAVEGKKFKSAGTGKITAFMGWMLGESGYSKKESSEAICNLIAALGEDGMAHLIRHFDDRWPKPNPDIFAGLNNQLVGQLADAWKQNQRYRPETLKLPKDFEPKGWYVDKKGQLKYRPMEHQDPVVVAWIELANALKNQTPPTDTGQDQSTEKFVDSILSPDKGFGGCMKCHSLTADGEAGDQPDWGYQSNSKKKNFHFNHPKHIRVMNTVTQHLDELADDHNSCLGCHRLDNEAGDASLPGRDFKAMDQGECANCHEQSHVDNDCQLCHFYHDGETATVHSTISAVKPDST